MSDNKELATIELPKELAELKNTAVGLPVDKADRILNSFAEAMTKLTEFSSEMEKVDFVSPKDIDAQIARKIRLKMVPERTGVSKTKDKLKEDIKLEDKLIMSCCNLLTSAYQMKEKQLQQVEDFQKLEQERLQLIKQEERSALLEPYNQAFDVVMIGAMSDDVFNNYLAGVKKNHEDRIEAERKAEEQRVEQERIVKMHGERKNALLSVWNFVDDEKKIMNFGLLSDEDFKQIHHSAIDKFNADKDAREKERAESERLRKEREEIEAKAKAEREAAEKKLRDEQEKARKEKEAAELKAKKEREVLEAKLAAERAENARIETERRWKEQEEKKKKEAEEKARKLAEKKAASAPDKTKLVKLHEEVAGLNIPLMNTAEGHEALNMIIAAISLLKQTIEKQISEL